MMIDSDLVKGALELERTERGVLPHRLPAWARAQTDDAQLHLAEAQPSGVRLTMLTEATAVELDVHATRRRYLGAPTPPPGVYDVVVNGELFTQLTAENGSTLDVDMMTGASTYVPGPTSTLSVSLPDGLKSLEIWLPHNEQCELVDLRANAAVRPVADDRRTWLHHGSSISHGSAATHPTGTWPAIAARLADVALVNLGVGGSALLDPFVARTIRDTPADIITLKLGINVVNQDLFRRRAFGPAIHGYLDTIRDGHPDTPLTVISPIYCPIHEEVPGPTIPDADALAQGLVSFIAGGNAEEIPRGKLSLTTIRSALEGVCAERKDANLHYLDGLQLYGPGDANALPLPDNLHPDGATHRLIGERFARIHSWR